MDNIGGQARASHSWTLLSSPRQGEQIAFCSAQTSCTVRAGPGNHGTMTEVAIASIYGAAGAHTFVRTRISKIHSRFASTFAPAPLPHRAEQAGRLLASAWLCAGSDWRFCTQERQCAIL